MNCDRAQLERSARMDGGHADAGLTAAVDAHVASCARCRSFDRAAGRARAAVRIREADPVPDLVGPIMSRVERLPAALPAPAVARRRPAPRWQRAMPVAAALVVGALIGSVLVGGPFRGRDPEAVSAAALVRGVRSASASMRSFEATFRIEERGLAPDVPVRRLDMRIAFLAPQRFRLDVFDRTDYPSAARVPNDVTYVEDASTVWRSAPTGCGAAVPGCPPTRTTLSAGGSRAFADLIVPMTTFGSAGGFRVVETEAVGDHDVVRVELPFARAAPMFSFLQVGGEWRPFFGGDRVELELDAGSWVPRRMSVFPAAGQARRAWELRFGLPVEEPNTPILDVSAVAVHDRAPDASLFDLPVEPPALSIADLTERVGARPVMPAFTGDLRLSGAAAPASASGPRSMLLYTDGLDFLRVTEHWPGRPGGGRGGELVELASGAVARYEAADGRHGRRLTIDGGSTTIVLETNLPRAEVLAIADSLPVRGAGRP